MTQLFLSFVIAVALTFCLSRFVVPICLKNLPIPVQIFPTVSVILTISIFLSSFGSLYYILAVYDKHAVPHVVSQQIVQPHPIEQTKIVSHPPDAKREAVRVLALEALRQGTALSVTISKLPKLEKVNQAARKLLDISPRYQEQVSAAEKELINVGDKRDKSLGDYLNKVVELGRYKPEYISFALDSIRNGDLTSRERIVADLLNGHVNSQLKGTRADPAYWLSEFTQRFSDYVD